MLGLLQETREVHLMPTNAKLPLTTLKISRHTHTLECLLIYFPFLFLFFISFSFSIFIFRIAYSRSTNAVVTIFVSLLQFISDVHFSQSEILEMFLFVIEHSNMFIRKRLVPFCRSEVVVV